MPQPDLFRVPRRPWNAWRIIGPKAPLKPKHIWAIRQQLKMNGRRRDLAMFNCAIDSKLRACGLVRWAMLLLSTSACRSEWTQCCGLRSNRMMLEEVVFVRGGALHATLAERFLMHGFAEGTVRALGA